MNKLPSWFVPIALFVVAIGSSWLSWVYHKQEAVQTSISNDDPIFTLKNALLSQFNAQGQRIYTLTSEYLQHFDDQRGSLLQAPSLYAFDPKSDLSQISWQSHSDQGVINQAHTEIYLHGNVTLNQQNLETKQTTTVSSPSMHILEGGSLIRSEALTTIVMPPYRSEGIGFTGFPHEEQFSLNTDVKSSYDPNSTNTP